MIEFFSAYIKTIVSLLLLSVFAEILMPEGGYKKYIKLLTGLIITLTVLNPVTYILGMSEDRLYGVVERNTEEILGNTFDFKMPENMETLEMSFYKDELSALISGDLQKRGIEAAEVSITADEDINSDGYGGIIEVIIYVSGNKNESDRKTRDFISGKYGVPNENIEFIYQ